MLPVVLATYRLTGVLALDAGRNRAINRRRPTQPLTKKKRGSSKFSLPARHAQPYLADQISCTSAYSPH